MKSSFDDSSSSPVFHALSLETVRSALDRAGCKPTPSGSGYTALCPVHEADGQGHRPSLSVNPGDKQPVVFHCHAGCAHDDIMAALDLKPHKPIKPVNGQRRVVATYSYCDLQGHEVRQKVRFEPKDFRIRHQDPAGQWVYKAGDGPHVLYRLPELNRFGDVYVCEGEKDVDQLVALGLCATTNIEGAAQPNQKPKWRPEYTAQLAGAERLILLPDNDDAGRAHMQAVAKAMRGKAGDIRWLELPGLPAKGDVSDWLNQGHPVTELLALAEDAPVIGKVGQEQQPAQEQQPPAGEPVAAPAKKDYRKPAGAQSAKTASACRNNIDPTLPTLPTFHVEIQAHQSYTTNQPSYTSYTVPLLEDLDEKGRPILIESKVAAALATRCLKGRFAFCRESLLWHTFTGTHWQPLTAPVIDEVVTQLLYTGAPHGFRARTLTAILSLLAKGLLPLPSAAADTRLIPFSNGLLNPETRTLTPITPDAALTWCLPYAYDPDADCPTIKAWLRQAVTSDDPEVGDNPDDLVEFLRAWLAALLTGRADLQRFLHLLGPGGTGKGTFIRLAEALVGTRNATVTDLKNLETNRFETAALHRKRLVAVTDSGKYGGSIDVFKAMTGQDPLRLERKHQQQGATFVFDGMVLIASNEPLMFTDYTGAVERRRMTIEFSRRISEDERAEWDRQGGETAILHREIPGVVNWVLGLTRDDVTRLIKDQPPQMTRLNREAMQHSNPVADWLLECVVPDPGYGLTIGGYQETTVSTQTNYGKTESRKMIEYADACAYPNYRAWCLKVHRAPVSTRRFSGLVLDIARTLGASVHKGRNSDGTYIKGLRLRQDADSNDAWGQRVGSYTQNVGSVGSSFEKSQLKTACYVGSAGSEGKTPQTYSHIRGMQPENACNPLPDNEFSNPVATVPTVPTIRNRPPLGVSESAYGPIAQTVIATIDGTPKSRAELERLVGHAHGKAGPALIGNTIDRLLLSGAIAPVGGLLHAAKAAKVQQR